MEIFPALLLLLSGLTEIGEERGEWRGGEWMGAIMALAKDEAYMPTRPMIAKGKRRGRKKVKAKREIDRLIVHLIEYKKIQMLRMTLYI